MKSLNTFQETLHLSCRDGQIKRKHTLISRMDMPSLKKKSVFFEPSNKVLPIIHISEYTREERNACWFSYEENRQRRWRLQTTMDSGDEARGLEKYHSSDNDVERKVIARRKALRAVFNEQSLQKLDCLHDAEKIAHLYSQHTYEQRMAAIRRANSDERAARDIFQKDREQQQ